MKVAVIGSGISGISAAEHLSDKCDVTLFEKNSKVGGHADTHTIDIYGHKVDVDTGFIVFNPDNYPRFLELLQKYDVEFQDSDMSFAVSNRLTGLEYNATSISKLFCQKRNLLNIKFYRMIADISRFYREAPSLLDDKDNTMSLGSYLKANKYGQYFVEEHIIPMASALWSGKADLIMDFPARYLVAFMCNHKMMQMTERPTWKTIVGGSKNYLNAIVNNASLKVSLNCSIKKVKRNHEGCVVEFSDGSHERFDKIIFACHSNQALRLLEQPSETESQVLSAIRYQRNEVCLHRDTATLPRNKSAWASWNVIKDESSKEQCTVSYYMNLLQSLPTKEPVIVSLNMNEKIDPDKVWKYLEYDHPVYTQETIEAQQFWSQLQGGMNSYYCGAYWGWGFHEDGAKSGFEAAHSLLKDIGYVS